MNKTIKDIGKKLVFKRDFNSLDEAEKWLKAQDCSVGRLQSEAPVGILRNREDKTFDIQKWRNLNLEERRALDGVIVLTGPRRMRTAHVFLAFEPRRP